MAAFVKTRLTCPVKAGRRQSQSVKLDFSSPTQNHTEQHGKTHLFGGGGALYQFVAPIWQQSGRKNQIRVHSRFNLWSRLAALRLRLSGHFTKRTHFVFLGSHAITVLCEICQPLCRAKRTHFSISDFKFAAFALMYFCFLLSQFLLLLCDFSFSNLSFQLLPW